MAAKRRWLVVEFRLKYKVRYEMSNVVENNGCRLARELLAVRRGGFVTTPNLSQATETDGPVLSLAMVANHTPQAEDYTALEVV